jgi:hypothetical protein
MNSEALMAVAFMFVVLGIVFLGLVVLVVACAKRKWKIAGWSIIGTLSLVAAMALLFYFIWRPYDPTSETDLKAAYRADFEGLPPPGITVLKARQIIVGDAGAQWLLLKASPDEIERDIAKGVTAARDIPRDFSENPGANVPAWWAPPTSRLQIYENKNWTKAGGWSFSEATMGVDRSSGLIWFIASKS